MVVTPCLGGRISDNGTFDRYTGILSAYDLHMEAYRHYQISTIGGPRTMDWGRHRYEAMAKGENAMLP